MSGHYNLNKKCKICGKRIVNKNKSRLCKKHCDRSGANNSFYGKKHKESTIKENKKKCRLASIELWKNSDYRQKVIEGISKPRSEIAKENISMGVSASYDSIGLRETRRNKMIERMDNGYDPTHNRIVGEYVAIRTVCFMPLN